MAERRPGDGAPFFRGGYENGEMAESTPCNPSEYYFYCENPLPSTVSYKKEALDYHEKGRAGKIEVISAKPCHSQKDLSLAYTPNVAEPCRVGYN